MALHDVTVESADLSSSHGLSRVGVIYFLWVLTYSLTLAFLKETVSVLVVLNSIGIPIGNTPQAESTFPIYLTVYVSLSTARFTPLVSRPLVG